MRRAARIDTNHSAVVNAVRGLGASAGRYQARLFVPWLPPAAVNGILAERHYLGPIARGFAYRDEFGILVLANPTSRRLPQRRWLELVRWCLFGEKNGGSRQWRRVVRLIRETLPTITTVVSYSDPSVGHTGALYKASNWKWAPTWHRLRPPPSGNGDWGGGRQSVKDRWVYEIAKDRERPEILSVKDAAIVRAQLDPRTAQGVAK